MYHNQYTEGNLYLGSGVIHYLVIIVVCFFTFFVNNQVIPADLMESRNLATAQEMVRYGNYLVPTMNGELRLEKPPLPTWIAAGVEHIIPGSLIAQRCVTGFMATLAVFFLYFLVSRLTRNKNIGLLSSLILATSFNIILMGRNATWDIYCHSFMLGAIYFLVVALEKRGKQWGYFIAAGLFLGLSSLSKGPVAYFALLLPFLISYIAVYRPGLREKAAPLLLMIVLCLVVSFWWTGYIYMFHEDALLEVARKEASSWTNRNVRPWYYYWKFPAEVGIWALFLVISLVTFFLTKRKEYQKEYKFGVYWFLSSLLLLSCMPEKKTRYLLPILIPAAIPVACYFYYSIRERPGKGERALFKTASLLIAVILLAIPIAMYVLFYAQKLVSLFLLAAIAVISWGIAAYVLWAVFGKQSLRGGHVFTGMILCMVMVTALCLVPVGYLFINEEAHSIRLVRDRVEVQDLPFYHNDKEELRMELVYNANRIIAPLDVSNDSLICRKVPFVLVSGRPVDSVFANKPIDVQFIDTYDNNWRKPGHKRYNRDLVREVAIIKSYK